MTHPGRPLRKGDFVEVLSLAQISGMLDATGATDGLPFMPEMVPFCGRVFRVARRADRTCVEGLGERQLAGAVFLEGLRCDGSAHDGCQRQCLLFWNEAWLRPAAAGAIAGAIAAATDAAPGEVEALRKATRDGERYRCQSTELARITTAFPSRGAAVRSLLGDLPSGEVGFARLVWILGFVLFKYAAKLLRLAHLVIPAGPGLERSRGELNLRSGELVEIRPMAEIRRTLDRNGKNNGLLFEAEMTTYHGVYEVDAPIERIILETTGKMRQLTHTVTLKGLTCQGLCARNCPRDNPFYWREIWLKRVSGANKPAD